MTECERIIKNGILPESFFIEETICDFRVTRDRKKLWAVGIDLLIQFDKVCRGHNLRYSLAFGSLLGCIRHNGFIPWDDDVDVFMPREDYERLKLYQNDFKYPYFLQFPGFDNDYSFSFAKLRNSNTSGVSYPFRYASFNQGFFIDIFPLDNFMPESIERDIGTIKHLVSESSSFMRRGNPFPNEDDQNRMKQFPIIRKGSEIRRDLDLSLRRYEGFKTDSYIAWSILTYNYKHLIFKKESLDELVDFDFYGYPIKITGRYKDVLSVIYGNYLALPSVSERGVWHSKEIFNPDKPYKETIRILIEKDKVLHEI